MKLIQLNAWGGRLENQLLNFIESENANFVCLQEIISIAGGNGGFFTPLGRVQKALDYKDCFMSPVFTFSFMRRKASFGNAVLSDTKFEKKTELFTNLKHNINFDFDEDDYNVRNLQHVVIPIAGQDLNLLNHHGHHIPEHKDGNAETMRQMKQIGEYIDQLKGPVILTGDFNLSPESTSLQQINNRLTNLPLKYKFKTTRTPLTHKKEVCDYIFVSDEIRVNNFYASEEIASDHQALILEFDI